MSLKILYGDWIEALAKRLVAELKAELAEKGPFEFLKVAVANPNLGNGSATYWQQRNWISVRGGNK